MCTDQTDLIFFSCRFPSQKAVLKLGAEKNNEFTFTVNGAEVPYFEYELKKKE